jgi:hypothetical protein
MASSPLNCWEVRGCGREPGGARVDEFGPCPAATFAPADGFLGGSHGGRACAYIAGTFCEGLLEGTYHDKSKQCWDCEFYGRLRREHGADFSLAAFSCFLRARSGR